MSQVTNTRKSPRLRQVATPPKGKTTTRVSHMSPQKNSDDSALRKSLHEFTEKINNFNESLGELKNHYGVLSKEIDEWKSQTTNDLRKVEEELSSIKDIQHEMKSEIQNLHKAKSDALNERNSLKSEINKSKEIYNDLLGKFSTLSEEHESLKNTTRNLQKELNEVKTNLFVERESDKASLSHLQEEIRVLKENQKNNHESLKSRIEKIDATNSSANLIISGDLLPTESPHEDTPNIVIETLKDHLKYQLPRERITAAYRIGRRTSDRGNTDKRRIILKLADRNQKKDLMAACIAMKVRGLYINEELTPEVNSLFYDLRQLRKNNSNSFFRLYTRDGVIKVKRTEVGKVYNIVTKEQLETFKHEAGL